MLGGLLMGARLVGEAFAFATRVPLKPNEMRLLLWMSLIALDSDRPPRYFAAREASALALGRQVPDAPDPLDPAASSITAVREAAFQRVKLATQGLARAGAIRNLRRGREGTRAEYELTFSAVLSGTESVPQVRTQNVPLSGSDNVLQKVRNPYPQGTTEENKEYGEEHHGSTAPSHLSPVEKPAERKSPDVSFVKREVA